MFAHSREKQFWIQWIKKYRSLRCLWDVNSKEYQNRVKRGDAYVELANFARSVHPFADERWARLRINSLRSSFRREMKKVRKMKAEGESYEPLLFYYKTMAQFLGDEAEEDQDFSDDGVTQTNFVDEDSENNSDDDPFGDLDMKQNTGDERRVAPHKIEKSARMRMDRKDSKNSSKISPNRAGIKRKRSPENNEDENFSNFESGEEYSLAEPTSSIKRTLSLPRNESELLGQRIASHFENMESNQRLIAEKIISDVCFYGRLGKLNMQSALLLESDCT